MFMNEWWQNHSPSWASHDKITLIHKHLMTKSLSFMNISWQNHSFMNISWQNHSFINISWQNHSFINIFCHQMFMNENDMVTRCSWMRVILSSDVYEWERHGDKMFMNESNFVIIHKHLMTKSLTHKHLVTMSLIHKHLMTKSLSFMNIWWQNHSHS
jgi:hypothetical protein